LVTAGLTSLEIASHVVVGQGELRGRRPEEDTLNPLAELEAAILPALVRAPCLVSFSGGHDSSLVLGVAVRMARRDGLQLPVPITWRFTDAPEAQESDLQDSVVRALDLSDWIRLDAGDDLDLVGPVSRRVLKRHGLLYPANAFLHAPLFDRAAGGTLLTGFGGDHVLAHCRRARRPWWIATPPEPSQRLPWLRPHPAALIQRSLARERHRVPRRVERRGRWRAARRDVAVACSSLAAVAEGAGCAVAHPLLEVGFLDALQRSGVSPQSAGGRAAMIRALFGEALPEACMKRRPKAIFRDVFWRRHTRAVLSSCDFDAIDDHVVDRDGLREEWSHTRPNTRTALLVQQAWLAHSCHDGDRAGL
jgi:hypothetical protein